MINTDIKPKWGVSGNSIVLFNVPCADGKALDFRIQVPEDLSKKKGCFTRQDLLRISDLCLSLFQGKDPISTIIHAKFNPDRVTVDGKLTTDQETVGKTKAIAAILYPATHEIKIIPESDYIHRTPVPANFFTSPVPPQVTAPQDKVTSGPITALPPLSNADRPFFLKLIDNPADPDIDCQRVKKGLKDHIKTLPLDEQRKAKVAYILAEYIKPDNKPIAPLLSSLLEDEPKPSSWWSWWNK